MTTYTITHKHCGATTTITGYDYWSACRKAGVNPNLWQIVKAEG